MEKFNFRCKNFLVKCAIQPWLWPEEPFLRSLSLFLNKIFPKVLDDRARCLEVFPTTNITSYFTEQALHLLLVLRNLLYLTMLLISLVVSLSHSRDGLKLSTSVLSHNRMGLRRKLLKQLKCSKCSMEDNVGIDLNDKLTKLLLDNRTTQHSASGVSPSFLQFEQIIFEEIRKIG